jgi:hypothetical protein
MAMMSAESITVRDLVDGSVQDVVLESFLGNGAYRKVYTCGDGLVAKVGNRNSNGHEVDVWLALKDTPAARFLCPIIAMSDDERVVVQVRVPEVIGSREARNYLDYEKAREKCVDDAQERRLYEELTTKQRALNRSVSRFTNECDRVLREYGISAYDMHEENIGITSDGSFVVIDYGNFWLDHLRLGAGL